MDTPPVKNFTALPDELVKTHLLKKKDSSPSISFDYFVIILTLLLILFLGAIAAYFLTKS